LQAMNTGHDGSLTTLHANSPDEVATRLTMMARYAMDLPVAVIEEQIISALDLVVQVDRLSSGARRVTGICEVRGSSRGGVQIESLVSWDPRKQCYLWHQIPQWLKELDGMGSIRSEEVVEWLGLAGLS